MKLKNWKPKYINMELNLKNIKKTFEEASKYLDYIEENEKYANR